MKQLFCLCFFLTGTAVHAQNWFDNNPKWINYFSFGFAGQGAEHMQVKGDTLADGHIDYRMERLYTPGSLAGANNVRYVRQTGDSIWAWREGMTGGFHIMYNFALGVGDSVAVPLSYGSNGNFRYTIDSIGTMLVDNQPLRFQHVQISTGYAYIKSDALIIEKIGMVNGHWENSDTGFSWDEGHHFFLDELNTGETDGPEWAFCQYQNDLVTYTASTNQCDAILTDAPDIGIRLPEPVILPNPFTERIDIQIPEDRTLRQIRMFDMAGKIIFSTSQPGQAWIDTRNFPRGQYLVELVLDNGLPSRLKAVKY